MKSAGEIKQITESLVEADVVALRLCWPSYQLEFLDITGNALNETRRLEVTLWPVDDPQQFEVHTYYNIDTRAREHTDSRTFTLDAIEDVLLVVNNFVKHRDVFDIVEYELP